ncbi:hypothetical protein [Rudaea sp.]|uniref:hypothetical protein n=1 Tax=Rudaea sp. TaxID=2136325 RepID=UPI0037849BEB
MLLKTGGTSTDEVFLYEKAHDHNFHLLTLGYFGGGYRTILFEYDNALVRGIVGESVSVSYLEDTKLASGRVMLYRENRDIHAQFPSEDFSISINIISSGGRHKRQYEFDIDLKPSTTSAMISKHLVGYMPTIYSRFAKAMGVSNVDDKLRNLLTHDIEPCASLAVEEALAASLSYRIG